MPPGWYPNQHGVVQWWDGTKWGPVAPPVAPVYVNPRPVKDVGIAYILLLLLGGFALHRFYLGYVGSAVTMLIMFWVGWLTSVFVVGFFLVGAVIVWWIVDLFLLPGMTRQANMRP